MLTNLFFAIALIGAAFGILLNFNILFQILFSIGKRGFDVLMNLKKSIDNFIHFYSQYKKISHS